MIIVTLLVIGLLLLISEIFLPGMIAGFAGFICLCLGVVLSFQEWGSATGGVVLLVLILILIIGFIAWLKYFPESNLAKPFVSEGQIGDIGTDRPELLGRQGHSITPLHPSGTAVFDGRHIDVVTEGEPIERDKPVKIIGVEGMRIVVRQIET